MLSGPKLSRTIRNFDPPVERGFSSMPKEMLNLEAW
jgi:hypothetical protein